MGVTFLQKSRNYLNVYLFLSFRSACLARSVPVWGPLPENLLGPGGAGYKIPIKGLLSVRSEDMADFDAFDAARKIFLAGVGAVATAGDKSSEMLDEFIRKGEETVQQGQALNEELKHRTQSVVDGAADGALKSKIDAMTDEEREEFLRKVQSMVDEAKSSHVTVDVEDAEPADDKAE